MLAAVLLSALTQAPPDVCAPVLVAFERTLPACDADLAGCAREVRAGRAPAVITALQEAERLERAAPTINHANSCYGHRYLVAALGCLIPEAGVQLIDEPATAALCRVGDGFGLSRAAPEAEHTTSTEWYRAAQLWMKVEPTIQEQAGPWLELAKRQPGVATALHDSFCHRVAKGREPEPLCTSLRGHEPYASQARGWDQQQAEVEAANRSDAREWVLRRTLFTVAAIAVDAGLVTAAWFAKDDGAGLFIATSSAVVGGIVLGGYLVGKLFERGALLSGGSFFNFVVGALIGGVLGGVGGGLAGGYAAQQPGISRPIVTVVATVPASALLVWTAWTLR